MSVSIVAPEIMSYIHSGLEIAAYSSVVDLKHAGSIHSHFRHYDVETESKRLIESWCELNRLSYWAAYNDKADNLYPFIQFKHHTTNIYQLLKYATCLYYNIELDTIKAKNSYRNGPVEGLPEFTNLQKRDYQLLKKWIDEIKDAIISNIIDYELANWSDIPGTKKVIPGYIQNVIDQNLTIKVKELTAPL